MTAGEPAASLRPAPLLDLEATLTCGQVFHWQRHHSGWLGAVGDEPVYAEQRSGGLWLEGEGAAHYFALDHPLESICATFPPDPVLQAAITFGRGLRLVRQPAWECLATFITSALKQIPHIAQISHTLRRRYGARLEWQGAALFAYPGPERIAALTEAELRACGLGFRARHLLGAARLVADGAVDLAQVATLPDAEARAELRRLPGVGEKVANCALLFGFERLRAFPIDVWIERVLRRLYFPRRRAVSASRLRDFAARHFGPWGGYAQQYLFHYVRHHRAEVMPRAACPARRPA